MGETIIFVAIINAAMAAAFVLLVLAACRWTHVGSASWYTALVAIHAELMVSLSFNYHYFATGEAFGFDVYQAFAAAWGAGL